MKRSGNNKWLIILMIISEIMLTGLLIQWLKTQWHDEKESLQENVNQQFMECINQVMDSMLVKHLIVPVLNDSSVTGDHLTGFNKRVSPAVTRSKQHVTAYYNGKDSQRQAVVTISLADSTKSGTKNDITFSAYDSAEKELLLRSVKLIIHQTGDSVGEWRQISHMISAVPDTNLLKNLFEKKIREKGDRLSIRWISDSLKNNRAVKGSILFLKGNMFEKPFNAEITHYQKIIFRRLYPQILFAIVLLTLTGAAFFFTYRSLKKQESLNILRNDFISNISHELKTPVSTVSIALEALKNFDILNDPVRSNEYLNIAFGEMKRLDQLISQVLYTSILEDQGAYLKLEETDLVSLARNVLSSMQIRSGQIGAKIEFNAKPDNITLKLDKLHIQGVLINLLDNSLKYCTESPEITIGIEQKPDSVILKIGDNGPGIPKEYISRVFEKFFRVPKGDIHDIKGYGLGLSFAYLVMKHHSGTISVRNKNEGGCEFTLTFPVRQP